LAALKSQRIETAKAAPDEKQLMLRKGLSVLFGTHPYGRVLAGTQESLAAISRDDVLSFYSRFYLANNAELLVYGDTTAEQVTKHSRAHLGTWKKGEIVPPNFRQPEKLTSTRIFLLDSSGAMSHATAVLSGVSRRAPDYFAANIAVDALNQAFTRSRIDAAARIEPRTLAGPLIIEVNAPTEKLMEQLKMIADAMMTLQNEAAGSEQLETARTHLLNAMADRLRSNTTVGDVILDIESYGLGRDYVLHFTDRVNAVTTADVQGAARQYLAPQAMVIVLSGPAAILEPEVKKAGSLTVNH
jgi:zinc protease